MARLGSGTLEVENWRLGSSGGGVRLRLLCRAIGRLGLCWKGEWREWMDELSARLLECGDWESGR